MTTTIKTVNAATNNDNTAIFYISCDGDIFDTMKDALITGPLSGIVIVDGAYCGSLDDMRSAAKEKFFELKTSYIGKQNSDDSTTYWFNIDGVCPRTGYTFDDETFGICHRDSDVFTVDSENYPLTSGDSCDLSIVQNCIVDDEKIMDTDFI